MPSWVHLFIYMLLSKSKSRYIFFFLFEGFGVTVVPQQFKKFSLSEKPQFPPQIIITSIFFLSICLKQTLTNKCVAISRQTVTYSNKARPVREGGYQQYKTRKAVGQSVTQLQSGSDNLLFYPYPIIPQNLDRIRLLSTK